MTFQADYSVICESKMNGNLRAEPAESRPSSSTEETEQQQHVLCCVRLPSEETPKHTGTVAKEKENSAAVKLVFNDRHLQSIPN